MHRIDNEAIEAAGRPVYGDLRLTGPVLAKRLGETNIQVWSWFHRRGMPVEIARKIADLFDEQAMYLIRAAQRLRRAANETEEAA